jgi:hypothetical protein
MLQQRRQQGLAAPVDLMPEALHDRLEIRTRQFRARRLERFVAVLCSTRSKSLHLHGAAAAVCCMPDGSQSAAAAAARPLQTASGRRAQAAAPSAR